MEEEHLAYDAAGTSPGTLTVRLLACFHPVDALLDFSGEAADSVTGLPAEFWKLFEGRVRNIRLPPVAEAFELMNVLENLGTLESLEAIELHWPTSVPVISFGEWPADSGRAVVAMIHGATPEPHCTVLAPSRVDVLDFTHAAINVLRTGDGPP